MSFIDAIQSAGPAADRADKMGLYGQFIGDWTMDATVYAEDGSHHEASGTIHFGWVLQGRAVQDVWILPGLFHGTTLRVYDPGLDAWHILWSDPLKQYYTRQLGRAVGPDIVQQGRNDAGEATRWRFVDITGGSFCWLGERSLDDGATWQLQLRMLARRVALSVGKPMLDHVSIGVSDIAAAKRFYDAVLLPLGYTLPIRGRRHARLRRDGSVAVAERHRSAGAARREIRTAFQLRRAEPGQRGRLSRGRPAFWGAQTTGGPAFDRTMVPATTPPSSSIPTATGSRRITRHDRAMGGA